VHSPNEPPTSFPKREGMGVMSFLKSLQRIGKWILKMSLLNVLIHRVAPKVDGTHFAGKFLPGTTIFVQGGV